MVKMPGFGERQMTPWKICGLVLAGLMLAAAAPKPAPKSVARPSAKPPAAHAAPARADAGDPGAMTAALADLGAKAETVRREADSVFLAVTSPAESFSAQFAGCDAKGKACQAVLFDRRGEAGAPSLPQVNAFNQASMLCRLYQDKGGKAHVTYSALLFAKDGRADLLLHLNAWRGCLGDFADFEKDPAGFLARAE
jgi:hypothetical protein